MSTAVVLLVLIRLEPPLTEACIHTHTYAGRMGSYAAGFVMARGACCGAVSSDVFVAGFDAAQVEASEWCIQMVI